MSGLVLHAFALVIVRHRGAFLLVHERKHGQGWYLPAGRVEPGEGLAAAAHRETLEESGVAITLEGILRIEHTPWPDGHVRMRIFYVARPSADPTPKSEPDEHSLGARWVTLDDLDHLQLRGDEVRGILTHVAAGPPLAPLTLITREGAPFLR
ncbi:MAG: NUDIX hydrolase [Nannocystaceae bacterium]